MRSTTSTIRVAGIGKQKLRALRAQAKAAGVTVEDYARRLLEQAVSLEHEARTKTFDELFGPAQEQFRESRMTEQELVEIVDAARTRHHQRTLRKRR